MFKIKRQISQAVFRNNSHQYPTGFSEINFVQGNILSNQTKFAVSRRGPRVWNRPLNQERKKWHMLMALKNW